MLRKASHLRLAPCECDTVLHFLIVHLGEMTDAQRKLPDVEQSDVAGRGRVVPVLLYPLGYSSGDPRKRGRTSRDMITPSAIAIELIAQDGSSDRLVPSGLATVDSMISIC